MKHLNCNFITFRAGNFDLNYKDRSGRPAEADSLKIPRKSTAEIAIKLAGIKNYRSGPSKSFGKNSERQENGSLTNFQKSIWQIA
jgi:hypothetical protein